MNIGEYCRNKYGISKIISNPNESKFNIDIFKKDGITLRCIKQKDVIKSSPNIIDLIEVGDLVYVDISTDDCGGIIVPRIAETERELNSLKLLIENKDYILKSIITHEQIESMEYKVKE